MIFTHLGIAKSNRNTKNGRLWKHCISVVFWNPTTLSLTSATQSNSPSTPATYPHHFVLLYKPAQIVNLLIFAPKKWFQFSSDQSLSCVPLFATPWTAAHQVSLSITNSQSPPKPMSVESVMPSNHLILCHPLLLPSIFPSIRVFSNELALHIRWPKYWSFTFSISPSNEHPGLISFRMDWLDLLTIQGTLKSLFQHHSSKASVLLCSAFFIV